MSKATDNDCKNKWQTSITHVLLRGKTLKTSLLQKRAADSAHTRVSTHAWNKATWQSTPSMPGTAKWITAKNYTYYFKLNKQLVDICHISQNQQSSNSREEGTRCSDHVPSFHRGAGVICKLPWSTLHQVTCTRGQDSLTLTSHSIS